jgi:SPP1 gp7 family putative phage head morphogenesis protein
MPDNPYQQEFWSNDEEELWNDVAPLLLEVYFSGIDGGVDALDPGMRVLVDFDHINTDALDFARRYRYDLIKGITETTRRQTQKAVSDWISSGAPLDALEAVLQKTFGSVRANMIAVTEVTRVFAEGNAAAWSSAGLVDKVRWNTAKDDLVCPICQPRAGEEYDLNDVTHRPPAHIRCRCWLQPVVSEERLAERLDEILA